MKRRYFITLLAAGSAVITATLPTIASGDKRHKIQPFQPKTDDEKAIMQVVADYNKHYETPVIVTRLVVVDGYALYSWVLDEESGGQTLLRKNIESQWKIVRGSGGQLDLDWLKHYKVPEATAQTLLKQMADQVAADKPQEN